MYFRVLGKAFVGVGHLGFRGFRKNLNPISIRPGPTFIDIPYSYPRSRRAQARLDRSLVDTGGRLPRCGCQKFGYPEMQKLNCLGN